MTEAPEHESCQHRKYSMTCEEMDALIERAGGRCEICCILSHYTGHGKLHIDHDAKLGTWAVRGLLCSRCNTMLGQDGRGGMLAGPEVDAYLSNPWRPTPPVGWKPRTLVVATYDTSHLAVLGAEYQRVRQELDIVSNEIAAEIRAAHAAGVRQSVIVRETGYTREAVRLIVMGRTRPMAGVA